MIACLMRTFQYIFGNKKKKLVRNPQILALDSIFLHVPINYTQQTSHTQTTKNKQK